MNLSKRFICIALLLSGSVLFVANANAQVTVKFTISGSTTISEGANGSANLLITLSRAPSGNERVEVPLTISGIGITANDFIITKRTGTVEDINTTNPIVIFESGANALLTIEVADDNALEAAMETATIAIGSDIVSNISGGVVADSANSSFQMTLTDNDYRLCFAQDRYIVAESIGTVSLPLKLSGPNGESRPLDETITVQFQYTDISTTNADYGTPTGSINIPQNTAMSILQLPITDDNIAESDEVLLITATPPKLPDSYQNCATEVVIKDNDLAVSIDAGEAVTEGATAAFTVTRSASQPTTLTVALNVSETGNFIAPENEGSVEISIAANQTTATFYVPTVDDTVIESRGQITVALADNPLGYKKGTPDTASLSINDNDPTVTISAGEAATEGALVSFTVTRNAPQTTPLEVFVDISESTGDFVSAANEGRKMITIATNQSSADYAIPTVEDDVSELKGQVTVALAEPTNAGDYYIGIPDTTTLTVYDNDCRYADDVDQDDDGLIEICDVNALDAIRYQLDGSGYQENMNVAENRQGCGADDSGICIGYELVKDLDFTADASYRNPSNPLNKNIWTNGAGWSPIGDASNAFTAIFEGNGHTISNFRINNNAMDYIGLFAKTSQSAKINRLVLSQVTISGRAMVGSLVGLNEGIISNIDVIGGSLTATGNNTGGLVAKNDGVIFNSRVALESVTGADNVGGLIGNNTAQVIDSFAFGTVTGTGTRVGDLIGLDEGQPFAVPEEKSLLHDLTISAETNVVLSPPFDPFIFDYKIIAEAERSTNILLKAAPSISRSINLDGTAETQTIISVGSGASESRYRFTAHYATIAISPDSVQADEGSSVSLTASHDLNLSDVSYSYNWFEKGGSSLNLADVTTTKNTLTFQYLPMWCLDIRQTPLLHW